MAFQISTSLLDACVLALLYREDAYGYSLTQNVKEIINVSESTLYPVLRRLQNEDYLTVYDAPYSGRNRRYYKITDAGKARLGEFIAEWDDYKSKVDRILLEGRTDNTLQTGGDGIEQN
ncbi:MAG: PadR family transcriptional regulator [Clostridiales bacterium]|nr:PadR family transcriptional regulator [Clostridiales bacterium]